MTRTWMNTAGILLGAVSEAWFRCYCERVWGICGVAPVYVSSWTTWKNTIVRVD